MTEEEVEAWFRKGTFTNSVVNCTDGVVGDCVQWHRTRASAERWDEDLETVEEEFRRTIRSYDVLSLVWTELGQSREPGGHRAYAMKKAASFRRMSQKGRDLFKAAGGTWPAEGQSLFEHVKWLRKQRQRYALLIIVGFKHSCYILSFSVLLEKLN
jgi:hypothetical protein